MKPVQLNGITYKNFILLTKYYNEIIIKGKIYNLNFNIYPDAEVLRIRELVVNHVAFLTNVVDYCMYLVSDEVFEELLDILEHRKI